MTDAGFEKIRQTDKMLYGPRKLLLTGFSGDVQPKFQMLLEMLGVTALPLVWASSEQSDDSLGSLMALADGFGRGVSSDLPRAIVVSGISEMELHNLMAGCRKAGMKQALWATLTPTSESWALGKLLAELEAERKAMSRQRTAED